jgi:4-hydroxybenzoate polyprenyltransferase
VHPGRDDATAAPARGRWTAIAARIDAYERLIRLDKPIGTLLLLWPTLSALWLAAAGRPSWLLVLVFTTGTVLMRSAGCAINDWADRHFDPHVERTAARPLATAEIEPWEALLVAAALAFTALQIIYLSTTRATVLLSLPAVLVAASYPFFKRFFVLPQAYLGIAFSFGIPMAFAAVHDDLPALAWWLLAINLFWVVAYDTEYAMVDRDDDVKLGLRTSAVAFGRFDVAAVMACYAVFLGGMAWVGRELSLGPLYYAGLAVAAGCALYHWRLIRGRTREGCFRAFLHNHWLGCAVFAGIALDYAVRAGAWPTLP